MRKLLTTLALVAICCSATGCANGPIRKFFRGAPCSTCNPPFGLFNRGSQTVGNCNDGVCGAGVAPLDGSMMGGAEFGSGLVPPGGTPGTLNPGMPATGSDTYPYPGTTGNATFGNQLNPNTAAPQPGPLGRGQ
jgi:hypothetical protein